MTDPAGSLAPVVDMDAAIGFVVAKGDPVERARLSFLRTGAAAPPDVLAKAQVGQAPEGGWPAVWGQVPSVDATCFHLTEMDDLGVLDGPAARRALDWLAAQQRPDGTWEEDEALADEAPAWARPGDPEARLFLTASAAYWLTIGDLHATATAVGQRDARTVGPYDARLGGSIEPPFGGGYDGRAAGPYYGAVAAAAQAIAGALGSDGTWPSYLAAGWLGAAVLFRQEMFYESARMQIVLSDRLPGMTPGDVAWMAASLRRVGVADDEWLMTAARRRLAETQRSDGGWPSEDGEAFDVHATLTAIRACR
jgi:hypothetical protein